MRSTIALGVLAAVWTVSACGTPESGPPVTGAAVYDRYCATCHGADGAGVPGAFPSLRESPWVGDDTGRLVRLLLRGMHGPLVRGDARYNNAMPPHAFLSDGQIAAVLTFVRSSFGHEAGPVTPDEVAAVRAVEAGGSMWLPDELERATGIPR